MPRRVVKQPALEFLANSAFVVTAPRLGRLRLVPHHPLERLPAGAGLVIVRAARSRFLGGQLGVEQPEVRLDSP
jgi:hypothetical protein